MAIVLALLIVGWLVAFALGNQAGFNAQPETAEPATANKVAEPTPAYNKTASVS